MPVGSGMRASASAKTRRNSQNELNPESDKKSREPGKDTTGESLKVSRAMRRLNEKHLSVMPPLEKRIFSGNMDKKSITPKGVHWLPRFAVLSLEYLAFAKVLEECASQTGQWMNRIGEISTNQLWEVFDKHNVKKNGLSFLVKFLKNDTSECGWK